MNFGDVYNSDQINHLKARSLSYTPEDIEDLLTKSRITFQDFPKLISPAAIPYIETLAQKAHHLTIQRFGKTIQAYVPLYLSNVCSNQCVYCGFNTENTYSRQTLSFEQIETECKILKSKGFKHILLLTGEAHRLAGMDFIPYMQKAIEISSRYFSSIGLEIKPLTTEEYKTLIKAGADSLTIYQETYEPQYYKTYHPKGLKGNFLNRLNTPDNAGSANFYRLNIGALLGLYEWRFEALALAEHISYLTKKYWQSKLSVSFPRIQKMIGSFETHFPVKTMDIVQFIIAFRLVFPDLGITLSTREPAELRDNLIPLGITMISAESQTSPGGYSGEQTEKQFEISDPRTLEEMTAFLSAKGYEVVTKDWDIRFQESLSIN